MPQATFKSPAEERILAMFGQVHVSPQTRVTEPSPAPKPLNSGTGSQRTTLRASPGSNPSPTPAPPPARGTRRQGSLTAHLDPPRTQWSDNPANGGVPPPPTPSPPPSGGGGGGGSGGSRGSPALPRKGSIFDSNAVILFLAGIAIAAWVAWGQLRQESEQKYNNTDAGKRDQFNQTLWLQNQNLDLQRQLVEAQNAGRPAAAPAPSPQRVFQITNGSRVTFSAGQHFDLQGPMSFVIEQSLDRVQKISGDYKLGVEVDGLQVWTETFSKPASTMSPEEFLKRFGPMGNQFNVRLTIKQGGVVRIDT